MSEYTTPPDSEAIAVLAERALLEIPEQLRAHVKGVGISVEEFADDETLHAMGIESEIHEIAHHFGFTEEEIEALER
jgi:predicted Zn-dependent protease with MMP-like domain